MDDIHSKQMSRSWRATSSSGSAFTGVSAVGVSDGSCCCCDDEADEPPLEDEDEPDEEVEDDDEDEPEDEPEWRVEKCLNMTSA